MHKSFVKTFISLSFLFLVISKPLLKEFGFQQTNQIVKFGIHNLKVKRLLYGLGHA